jgi:magnesium transporter
MRLGRSENRRQASLAEIVRLLQRHRVLDTLTHRQEGARRELLEHLQHQQNLVEVQARCRSLHPADLAFVLESLPLDDRALVWSQAPLPLKGAALLELSDAVREGVVEATDAETLVGAIRTLEPEDLAWLEGRVPDDVWHGASAGLDVQEQRQLREAVAWPDDTVGHLMTHEVATVRETTTAGEALAALRAAPALPRLTDRLFVVDGRNVLRGAVSLPDLIRADPSAMTASVMATDLVAFGPDEAAADVVLAFARYDLVTAPVADDRGKLLGRLTVDAVIEHARAAADRSLLARAGLQEDEDLFAPVIDSARNRWPWLMVNLLTAFVASRVIGMFEHTIGQLVALATLMPIVASIGGNTGNQTVALVIRGLALGQLPPDARRHLVRKELRVSMLNGVLWGAVIGLAAIAIYHRLALGIVMMSAVFLNLLVAALAGVAVPLALQHAGRDPAQGASVLLTFVTDGMGFLLFLGLASVFLL